MEEGGICPFFPASSFELRPLISSSPDSGLGYTPLAPLVLRPSNLEWITPLAFLGLQLQTADRGISQPPQILFLWRTLTTTDFWNQEWGAAITNV